MARGLAIIHWHAGIDGMDIEFVLGGADGWDDEQMELVGFENDKLFPTSTTGGLAFNGRSPLQHATPTSNANTRRTQLYALDFDKASCLSFDRPDVAIRRLVTAVTCNDPYFPAQQPAIRKTGCFGRRSNMHTLGRLVRRRLALFTSMGRRQGLGRRHSCRSGRRRQRSSRKTGTAPSLSLGIDLRSWGKLLPLHKQAKDDLEHQIGRFVG
jgi:hypothetical protein